MRMDPIVWEHGRCRVHPREISRHWPLDRVTPGAVLQRYPDRMTGIIHADQGDFVVKAYASDQALGLVNPGVAVIDQQLAIFDYLGSAKVGRVPRLLRTRAGNRFARISGITMYVLERVDGVRPADTPETWSGLGQLAARLNAHTDYPHAYAVPVRQTIIELLAQASSYPFAAKFRDLVMSLDILADQPSCLLHAELNPANALRLPDGQLCLLDWDQAGSGPWPLEAGYPLLTWFVTEDLTVRHAEAAAFYRAYASGSARPIRQPDLVFTGALLHALRYLRFGDPARRWARIMYALAHRDTLLAMIASR